MVRCRYFYKNKISTLKNIFRELGKNMAATMQPKIYLTVKKRIDCINGIFCHCLYRLTA